jgi:hypothetical protein
MTWNAPATAKSSTQTEPPSQHTHAAIPAAIKPGPIRSVNGSRVAMYYLDTGEGR